MNIVFGGAFNPPQNAHEKIVKLLLNKFSDAKVIILPVGDDYQKRELVNFNDRYQMLKLLFKDEKRVVISNLENRLDFKGTFNSLNILSKDYQNLYFVMGTDNLKTLKSWINYEELIRKYPFIFIERNQDDLDNLIKEHPLINEGYYKIKFDEDISSSKIRENLNKYQKNLNEEVLKYIKAHQLYGGERQCIKMDLSK